MKVELSPSDGRDVAGLCYIVALLVALTGIGSCAGGSMSTEFDDSMLAGIFRAIYVTSGLALLVLSLFLVGLGVIIRALCQIHRELWFARREHRAPKEAPEEAPKRESTSPPPKRYEIDSSSPRRG